MKRNRKTFGIHFQGYVNKNKQDMHKLSCLFFIYFLRMIIIDNFNFNIYYVWYRKNNVRNNFLIDKITLLEVRERYGRSNCYNIRQGWCRQDY